MRASREPVIVPGGSGGTARSPTASHEWLEARHRDGTRSLSGHARLQARRSDHSGQRGAAGTIRAIEKCLPRSSRQGVAQSPRTRPAPYKTAFGSSRHACDQSRHTRQADTMAARNHARRLPPRFTSCRSILKPRLPSIESLPTPTRSQSCACSSSIQVRHPTS